MSVEAIVPCSQAPKRASKRRSIVSKTLSEDLRNAECERTSSESSSVVDIESDGSIGEASMSSAESKKVMCSFAGKPIEFGNANEKPAYSYAALIALAINNSEHKRLTLTGIYQWILDNFPYYQDHETSWKVCELVMRV